MFLGSAAHAKTHGGFKFEVGTFRHFRRGPPELGCTNSVLGVGQGSSRYPLEGAGYCSTFVTADFLRKVAGQAKAASTVLNLSPCTMNPKPTVISNPKTLKP